MGKDAVPTHEDAFHNIVDKLLESAWPADSTGKRKPNEVDAGDVDKFQKRVELISKALEPWIELRSWFLERVELWQTWVDVPPKPYASGTWAAIIADARRDTAADPKNETDALEALIKIY